jgi:hypothetical protein
MTLTPEQLHILQHSLGCNEYGLSEHRGSDEGDGCFGYYRNRYVSPPNDDLIGLVQLGYMRDHALQNPYICRHHHCFSVSFSVTREGVAAMLAQSPRPPRVSRARRRYLQWLHVADAFGGMKFGEWLRRKLYKPR